MASTLRHLNLLYLLAYFRILLFLAKLFSSSFTTQQLELIWLEPVLIELFLQGMVLCNRKQEVSCNLREILFFELLWCVVVFVYLPSFWFCWGKHSLVFFWLAVVAIHRWLEGEGICDFHLAPHAHTRRVKLKFVLHKTTVLVVKDVFHRCKHFGQQPCLRPAQHSLISCLVAAVEK